MDTDANYLQLLRACDEEGSYEFPVDFDSRDIEQRARSVFSDIKRERSASVFEGWLYHQDASFGLAIDIKECNAGIRFSNFGNLVHISGSEALSKEFLDIVYLSFEANGFHPIPSHILMRPYDGVMRNVQCLPTWWVRYFDWI